VGSNRRQTMHLTDDRRFLANETDDPLRDAFDRKLAVHAMPRNQSLALEQLNRSWVEMMSGDHVGQAVRTLYIHIPFCQGHCLFCGFYQNAYKTDAARRYVDVLLKEMAQTAAQPFVKRAPFLAVYFGGGTPTAMASEDIHRMVSFVKERFPLANDCELTFEGRFYDFGSDKITAALDAGVTRFSLGVQTFDTRIRKSIARREPGEKLIETLTRLRDTGRATIIIDLIYGLPGQTLEIWEKDIETYLDLGIDGCDLYQLNIFTGGPLDMAVEKGLLPQPASLRDQAGYFQRGVDLMKSAHQRRLSLNHWAQNAREQSLYNSFSRGRSECVPLGAGAGGWIGDRMFFLEGELKDYTRLVEAGKKPLAMGFGGNGSHLLFRDISYQIELGYCDLKSLSTRHRMDLFAKVGPVVTQWEKVGLIRIDDGCLRLTRAGEFWAVNLAQILIDMLQMSEK
jgi:oxygen-independent coproporphyrinogen-3 oxidase